jgi:RNA polymerase sigma-70 factor (sigma-E family)
MEPPARLLRVRVVGADGSRVVSDESLELELLTARIEGDRDAEFAAFMAASMPALHRSAFLLCGDAHRADELTQHALKRTYRAWPRARAGDPMAYARRVLMNLRVDGWRRTRREVLVDPHTLGHDAPWTDPDLGDRDEVLRALLALPLKQRRVVVLRYLLDLSEAEVAAELDVPLGTVKSTASRALASLRSALGPAIGRRLP